MRQPRIRLCSDCGKAIPKERLAALPDAEQCVGCSSVEKVTSREFGIVDGADLADVASATRQEEGRA